jgi:hypothetical protein
MNYTGTKDGAAKGKRAGLEAMQQTLMFLFNGKNLGTWVVRNMRNNADPPQLSVHATGRAADIQPKTDADTNRLVKFLVDNAETLHIEEVHDYKDGTHGRGWRCWRRELDGKAGWKQWSASDNGGSAGALWCHYEVAPDFADSPAKVEAAFKQIFGK